MNKIRKAIRDLCDNGFSPASSCHIEGWGAALAAGALVAGVAGAAISSSAQAGAAHTAANAQEQAAEDQLSLSSNIFNAQGAMSLPTREVGGEAQSREAYLLGLDPNLNIGADFSTPNIQSGIGGSTLSWNGPGPGLNGQQQGSDVFGNPTGAPATATGTQLGGPSNLTAGGGTMAPSASGPGATLSAGGTSTGGTPNAWGTGGGGTVGVTNPNAIYGGSGFGSFASPYSPSTFYQDPGYQFILNQGQNAIQNHQATTGMALSPAALSAGLQYTTGLASQEFNNAYNRSMNTQTTQLNELNALSSGGQIATSGLSTAASNFGAAGSSALAGYGNAAAAGAIGGANALSSGINGATNAFGGAANYAAMNGGFNGYSSTPATTYNNGNTMTVGNPGLDGTGGYIVNVPD
jgi:hypothetical protein